MPTNIPPEAWAKFEEYKRARTPEEKLQKLREFYALMPKHKGTEKMEKFIRRRMAELRREIEARRRRGRRGGSGPFVEKKGAAQLVLLGFTNSGRSTVLAVLTNARPRISPAPFTTAETPEEGMMKIKGAYIQVVEAPPLIPGGGGRPTSIALGLAMNADALGIVLNGEEDPVGTLEEITSLLMDRGVRVGSPAGKVRIN
ncbi:MAG: GTP-binding protein, partial [Thermoproteota archaeon]